MFVSSECIVLSSVKFEEKDLIVQTFTKTHGVIGFLVKNAFSIKSKFKAQYFQPFNVLNVQFNYNQSKNLHFIKDFNLLFYNDQVNKISTRAYLSFHIELINQIKSSLLQSDELFEFYIGIINNIKSNLNYYQIPIDLLNLFTILGHRPSVESYEKNKYFNLNSGHFDKTFNPKQHSNSQVSELIFKLLNQEKDIKYDEIIRKDCIEDLIKYAQIHIKENLKISSIELFRRITNN